MQKEENRTNETKKRDELQMCAFYILLMYQDFHSREAILVS